MSYIRYGHDLKWFNCKSALYVYDAGNGIEDYGGSPHMPSVIEHIGNMIYRETKDLRYSTLMVIQLAHESGIKKELRTQYVPVEKDGIRELFNKEINRYVEMTRKMLPVFNHRLELWSDTE